MEREQKIIILLIIVLSTVGVSAAIYWGWSVNWLEQKVIKEIWLPADYSLANKQDNTYFLVSDVRPSGTAVFISLEDFKQRFTEGTVVITDRGKVYYLAKGEEVTYVATDQLAIEKGESPAGVTILSDREIELRDNGIAMIMVLGVLAVVAGIIVSVPLGMKINKHFPGR